MVLVQIMSHIWHRRQNCVTFYGRTADGQPASFTVQNFNARWVLGGTAPCPQTKCATRYARTLQGCSLLSSDCTTVFREYYAAAQPLVPDGAWYDRRLDAVHQWHIRNKIPRAAWFNIPKTQGIMLSGPGDLTFRHVDAPGPGEAAHKLICIDIETMVPPDGSFPNSAREPIIQISAVVDNNMFGTTQSPKLHMFSLGSLPNPLPKLDEFDPSDTTMHCFGHERHLLRAFAAWITAEDPEVISGWNTDNFDWPYIFDRFEEQQVPCIMGKDGTVLQVYTDRSGCKHVRCAGRVMADMLPIWRKEHKERSFKLDAVAQAHLGASKAPMAYTDIPVMQKTEEGRGKLATYCVKDAWLVWRLGSMRKKWINAIEMSRTTYADMASVFSRGQQWRVFSMLSYYAYHATPRIFVPDVVAKTDAGYEGAVVIKPITGFHRECVVTLDFASLYPSVMLSQNMCYSTLRTTVSNWELSRSIGLPEGPCSIILQCVGSSYKPLVAAVPADARAYRRCGASAFKRDKPGLLPLILQTLLSNRKRAKKAKAKAKTPLERDVQDGRQLALKLIANSMYGFCGAAEVGMLPCPPIAAAVTYVGRQLALNTKRLCEQEPGVQCVYGDTDSVFLRLDGEYNVERASKRAVELAEAVNRVIPPPNKLEFEKVYLPLILGGKKRYAGTKYEEGRGPPCIDVKGYEMVRRDNFPLLNTTMRQMVERMLEGDVHAGESVARRAVHNLLTTPPHKLDHECLTICKELTKPVSEYAAVPPHVAVAQRMANVSLHDRVPYLKRTGRGGVAQSALHPDEWDNTKHTLDTHWYAEQMKRSLMRILVLCSDNAEAVFENIEGAVMATGQTGILRALGAPANLVWRKTSKEAQNKKRKHRQLTLLDVLK